jgi:predicted nucleic acid-binding protein
VVRYLVDTNVVSEMGKGVRCDLNVAAWYASVEQSELRLSALVIGEIRTGVETLRPRAPRRAHNLERWLFLVVDLFADRIIAIDRRIAEQWGRLNAVAKRPAVDGLMAATALVHGLTVVTRNVRDFAPTGAQCLNPFDPIR